jgi:hypothetical protein
MSAAGTVALILLGGPVAMGAPILVARALVESHADRSAAAIRARYGLEDVDQADDVDEMAEVAR